MKVVYADNPDKGPGNGYLIFSGEVFPDGPWEAAVQVPSSQEYLTGKKGKWLGDEIFIPLAGEVEGDGSIRLNIGPNIVDSLGSREKYRVKLRAAGGGEALSGRLTIDQITYSPVDTLDNTAKISDAPEDSGSDKARNVAPPASANGDVASQKEKEAEPAPREEDQPGYVVVNNDAPEEEPEETENLPENPPPSEKAGKSTILVAAIAILALIGAGIGGYFLYKKFAEEEGLPVAETSAPPVKTDSPAPPPRAESPAAPAITERINGFFAQADITPKKAMELAQTLAPETPRDQDALYRLYNYAGERGEPSALLVYGACLDPSKPQWGSIEKDGLAAWEIYGKAKKANVAGADEAIANLQRWLENAANKGDSKAAAQLRQIQR